MFSLKTYFVCATQRTDLERETGGPIASRQGRFVQPSVKYADDYKKKNTLSRPPPPPTEFLDPSMHTDSYGSCLLVYALTIHFISDVSIILTVFIFGNNTLVFKLTSDGWDSKGEI